MSGQTTINLPLSTVPCDVDYWFDENQEICLDVVTINDETIPTEELFYRKETTKPSDLVRSFEYVSLEQYFQECLNEMAEELKEDEDAQAQEDARDFKNER